MKLVKKILALATLVVLTPLANASLFSFDVNPQTGGAFGNDKIDKLSTSFDDVNQRFTWSTRFAQPSLLNNNKVNGFWLVVNNGPNPKASNAQELAIMYGDLDAETLTTFVYNGENNANSIINPGILLQTDSLVNSTLGFSFDISTAAVNAWPSTSSDYTGISFDENIGIWFHFSTGSEFSYNSEGDLVGYTFDKQGWYDVANRIATVSPSTDTSTVNASAPGALALVLTGLVAIMWRRKKR